MQSDFLANYKLPIEACKSFELGSQQSASAKDPYNDDFASVHNLLCQLNSIDEVTSLWRTSTTRYDAVVYLRPDVLYTCLFPIDVLETLQDNTVYVPDFHAWGGINDRFAIGKPDAVVHWSGRVSWALSECMRKPLHAETLLASTLKHRHVHVQKIPFYFMRVRATGELGQNDVGGAPEHRVPVCNQTILDDFLQQKASRR